MDERPDGTGLAADMMTDCVELNVDKIGTA